ncbi:IMPACT family protein [Bacteroides propionicifaciens]|uniref:IMPACT family protein n=1 Tax=Bacteroides propionicifaciens TaxID=392838 RepID=UPI00046820ED|nr:YigZ family protein [Bacteroides propionicifaciens]
MEDDIYKTIEETYEGSFSEKRSKFVSLAIPVNSEEEVKSHLDELRKIYYDARHICWAYHIGTDEVKFRANDDGEPSGTAGRPILGQIRSFELTDILIAVVRYFGGIKLGTGGLVVAYKAAAANALEQAVIVEKTINETVSITFEYPFMNEVMRIVKEMEPTILSQNFEMSCAMTLQIRRSQIELLRNRLSKVQSLLFVDEHDDTEI